MASVLIGPKGRNPDYFRLEHQYANIIGAQTAVIVSKGGGMIHTVWCGVVGTLAEFYDVAEGGTTDATTRIGTFSLAALTDELILDIAFSQGLTVIVTGGASTAVGMSFRGAQTVSPRNFGTIDWNPGR